MHMRRTGIMGALDEEIAFLLQRMTVRKVVKISGKKFYVGRLNQVPIVLVKSGVAKVNAGLASQILIDRFCVKRIIWSFPPKPSNMMWTSGLFFRLALFLI